MEEKAMITKADKGNSIVILYINDYNKKIEDFISNNNFTLVNRDTTNKLQHEIRATIEACCEVIPREDRWRNSTQPLQRATAATYIPEESQATGFSSDK
jgi:hypothetical protein